MQTKVCCIFLYSVWKETNDLETLKCSSCNKLFLQCVCHWYGLFQWMFFILCDNWKRIFFIKVYRYSEGFSNHHAAVFFERSVSKEVHILHYLHNSNTMILPELKNKVYTCKISLTNLMFWLRCVAVKHFSLWMIFN